MTISTNAQLETAVASWLHRADLTSIVPDLVMLGEKRIFREVRAREMETALSVTISSGVATVPSDYIDLKFAYVDGAPTSKLTRASPSQIYEQYPLRSSGGKPVKIAREGANFIFGPYPGQNYTIKGIYYAEPTAVATSANALFVANPDLYLFAALAEAAPYLKNDKRIGVWEGKYNQIKNQIDTQEAKEERSGGGMAVSAA